MDLYNDQEFIRALILSHATKPTNLIKKEEFIVDNNTYEAKTVTSTCTDDLTILLKIDEGRITEAKFYGVGCVISTATTDMILNAIKNKNIKEVEEVLDDYLTMTFNGTMKNVSLLGDLQIYKNIYKQANRISCSQTGAKSVQKIMEKWKNHENN